MNTITATELKLHASIRKVFAFIELAYYWITAPIVTFKIVFRGSSWVPVRGLKNIYMQTRSNGMVAFRHKKQPGEFVADTKVDPTVILEAVSAYFGLVTR